MRYLKYIFTLIFIIFIFWWWVILWYLIPQYGNISELEKWIPSQIRACNETNVDFTYILVNREYFGELKASECTEYKYTYDLYKTTTIDVYTNDKNGYKNNYSNPIIDIMWDTRLILWKHTVYIKELKETKNKTIKYEWGVKYEIE